MTPLYFLTPSVLSPSVASISAILISLPLFSDSPILNTHLDTHDRGPARASTACIDLRFSTHPIRVVVDHVPTRRSYVTCQEPEANCLLA